MRSVLEPFQPIDDDRVEERRLLKLKVVACDVEDGEGRPRQLWQEEPLVSEPDHRVLTPADDGAGFAEVEAVYQASHTVRQREVLIDGIEELRVRTREAGRLLIAEALPSLTVGAHGVLEEALAFGLGQCGQELLVGGKKPSLLDAPSREVIHGEGTDERGSGTLAIIPSAR